MWNKIAEFVQAPNSKRLVLALVVSVVLHVYLMGGIDISLPKPKQELHTIEARLQMPKVVGKKVVGKQEESMDQPVESISPPPIKNEKTVIKKIVSRELPVGEAIKKPVAEIIEASQETDLSSDFSENVSEMAIPEKLSDQLPNENQQVLNHQTVKNEAVNNPAIEDVNVKDPTVEDPAQQTEPQPIDAGLVINENAYQYVETDFDVRTEIDGAKQGGAKIIYSVNQQQYQLKSVIKPEGLAALIISDLLQTSDGMVTKNGLQPNKYLYQYGNKADKTYTAEFDWLNKNVRLITVKGTKTAHINDGTQDLLSFMYQFMYVPPLERMQISIATGKKLSNYKYSFDGEENINIPMGEIKTLHILHSSEDHDEKTELWLALDYQYVPVKIRKTEKNGKIYELVATQINTARPVLN